MNKIKDWIDKYPYLAVICVSVLFINKPINFESFGYFLLVAGVCMWYTKEQEPQQEMITFEDVEEIAALKCHDMIVEYMKIILQPDQGFEGDPEGFDADTFPPFNPFDEDNPFSEN